MNADAVRSPPAMLINLNGIGPESLFGRALPVQFFPHDRE
jgi:hypothetical protein